MPGTGRLTPRGSGGAGTDGRGKRTACSAADTFLRVARDRPATSPSAAAATATPAVVRNCRRAVGPARPVHAGGTAVGGPERNPPPSPPRDPPALAGRGDPADPASAVKPAPSVQPTAPSGSPSAATQPRSAVPAAAVGRRPAVPPREP